MELKKNPNKDLNNNSGLYFIAGLALVLILTYTVLEWKTFEDFIGYDTSLNIEDELLEEVSYLIVHTPPPPAPIAPAVIEIIPDDPGIIETEIMTTEADQDKKVINVSEVVFEEVDEDLTIPISVVEEVPVFPGCENEADKRACFQAMMNKHIIKNFRYPEVEQELGIQGKVYLNFIIQKDGSIGQIQILRSPNQNLGTEATRIIGKLPKMTPGKQGGKAVRVPFSLPINFKLQ